MQFKHVVAAGLAVIGVVTLSAQVSGAAPTEQQQAQQKQAIQTAINNWAHYYQLQRMATHCPIAEPWQITGLKGMVKSVGESLKAVGFDIAKAKVQLNTAVDVISCSPDVTAKWHGAVKESAAVAYVQIVGGLTRVEGPCTKILGQNDIASSEFKKNIKALATGIPNAEAILKRWQAVPPAAAKAMLCDAYDNVKAEHVRDMVHDARFLLGGRAAPKGRPIELGYGEVLGVSGVTAKRAPGEGGLVNDPEMVVVARASQAFDPASLDLGLSASDVWVTRAFFHGNTSNRGKDVHGVQLAFYASATDEKPYKTLSSFKQLKDSKAGDIDPGLTRRVWEFSPATQAAFDAAPASDYIGVIADVTDQDGRRVKQEWAGNGSRLTLKVRHPVADLRWARSWVRSEGPVGRPIAP